MCGAQNTLTNFEESTRGVAICFKLKQGKLKLDKMK